MFREMKNADTPLAREVQAIMKAGSLVPDDVTYRMVKERTSREDCRNGYILDGYPRTAVQAAQLEELAAEQRFEIRAIEVDVPTRRAFETADWPALVSGLRRDIQYLFEAAEKR
jgi:adenylate kinase